MGVLEPADAAGWAIAARVEARVDELADRLVERYCEEIVAYARLDEEVRRDVGRLSLDYLRLLLANLGRAEALTEAELDRTRAAAAARVHQDVPLESFLHALRLWSRVTWESVLEAADPDRPEELRAALRICGRVLEFSDQCSTAVTQAYLDEFSRVAGDRELLRRDLLDALAAGRGGSESVQRLARGLGLPLARAYAVVVARSGGPPAERSAAERSAGERTVLRRVVEAARTHLRPPAGSLLLGVRDGEVVVLYPAAQDADMTGLRRQGEAFAAAVAADGVSVGLGGRQEHVADVALAYDEARRAADIAVRDGIRGAAVELDDVLIEHLAGGAPHAQRLLDRMLRALQEYDSQRGAELLPTLRAYLDSGLRVSRAAGVLNVHPNTMLYRLRRIKELSGRDPHDPEDLALLVLALKAGPPPG